MSEKTVYEQMMEDKEFARLMAQEDLILDITEKFCDFLQAENVKRSSLAEMMGKTKGFVSQILNGGRNLTLRTMADVAFYLGYAIELKFVKKIKNKRKDILKLAWAVDQKGFPRFEDLNKPDHYDPPTQDISSTRIAV